MDFLLPLRGVVGDHVPQNAYVETLPPGPRNVTLFGGRVFF